jgi:hypothetical protein
MACGMNDSSFGDKSPGGLSFRDPGIRSLTGPALVICPQCHKAAHAFNRKFVCLSCSYSRMPDEPQSTKPAELLHMAWQPRCRKCATMLPKTVRRNVHSAQRNVPVRCAACHHVASYPARRTPLVYDEGHDPSSGLPYYLDCCVGRYRLWARNLDHLDLLEAYIIAQIRKRPLSPAGMTMLARLPHWIKAAKNRKDLLRAIRRLRASVHALR